MVPDFWQVFAVVIVLGSLTYFSLACTAFLFVRLDIPEVWRLFRGLFDNYFRVIGVVGLAAAIEFGVTGNPAFAALMLLLAATVTAARGAVLQRIDTQHSAGRAGDAVAMRQLRKTHLAAMLVNLAFLASVASCLPFLF